MVLTENIENTSSHHPVVATICITLPDVPVNQWTCEPPPPPPDHTTGVEQYCNIISYLMPAMDHVDTHCPEAYCETLMHTLHYAASRSIPRPKSRNNRQVWDIDVSHAMAANKDALREWLNAGRPSQVISYEDRKHTKFKTSFTTS